MARIRVTIELETFGTEMPTLEEVRKAFMMSDLEDRLPDDVKVRSRAIETIGALNGK